MTHTPGPWEMRADGCVHRAGHKWGLVKIISPWREEAWDGDPEAIANARLIAAAPEMLAALKQIEAFGSQELQTRNVKFTIAQKIAALNAARAAIAKAEAVS
jgi:hypothetical protein